MLSGHRVNTSVVWLQQEGEVGALTRRIALLEVDYEQTSARLSTASDKLDEASKHAEEAERWAQDNSVHARIQFASLSVEE